MSITHIQNFHGPYSLSGLGVEGDLVGLDVKLGFSLNVRGADGEVDDVLLGNALGRSLSVDDFGVSDSHFVY